ncbi:dihydrofolate reductase family protein [Nocardioides sp. NPDC126508]
MGRIIISTNVTLDGVSQDPTGEEKSDVGGWFLEISGSDRDAWAALEHEEAKNTAAYLLGARSYEWFASRWVGRQDAWATLLNGTPKYVVRSGAGRSDWGPTTALDGEVGAAVRDLKARIDGDIVVYASYQLVEALLAEGMVDEIRLVVFPSVNGGGGRLFDSARARLSLREARPLGTSLVYLNYDVEVAR